MQFIDPKKFESANQIKLTSLCVDQEVVNSTQEKITPKVNAPFERRKVNRGRKTLSRNCFFKNNCPGSQTMKLFDSPVVPLRNSAKNQRSVFENYFGAEHYQNVLQKLLISDKRPKKSSDKIKQYKTETRELTLNLLEAVINLQSQQMPL